MSDIAYQPLKGDPVLLAAKAKHYGEIAQAIARSATTLAAIADDNAMTSKAVDALRDSAKTVGDDISKAKDRYQETSAALVAYAAALSNAQSDANAAIARITALQEGADRAHAAAKKASTAVDDASDTDKAAAQKASQAADHAAQSADASLASAHQAWHDALDAKNAAAQTAITAIVGVVENSKDADDLNDSWWDDWGKTVFDIFKSVCDWAGILAIFLSWVPILGEVLLVLAAIGAVLDLVEAIVNVCMGKGSGWDIVFAAVGAVLTLFGGKIFAFAAKELRAGAILKSGVTEGKALARLEGVGRRSEDFMTAEAATKQSEKSLWSVFASPFVRDEAATKAMNAYKAGEKSAADLVKAAAKEALPVGRNLEFDLGKLMGQNKDLATFANFAKNSPESITTGMKAMNAALHVYQVETYAQKGVDLYDGLTGEHPGTSAMSFALGGFSGDWGEVVGGMPDRISESSDAAGAGVDLVQKITSGKF